MKYIVFLSLFLLNLNIFTQKSWYKCFEGNIGDTRSEMHLVKYEDKIHGYFWFNGEDEPYVIFGSIRNDSLILYSYRSSVEISFNGYFSRDKFYGNSVLSVGNFREGDISSNKENLSFNLIENKDKSAKFEFVYVYGTHKLFRDIEDSPSATYTEGCIWPVKTYPYFSQISNLIIKEKNFPSGLGEIGKTMIGNKKKFIEAYKEETKGVTKKEASEYPASLMRDETDITTIAYINSKLLVIGRYIYTFFGGAHGNYSTLYSVMELATGKQIKLDDIIKSQGHSMLSDLLEKYFRLQYFVKPNESLTDFGLFENTIKPNENFILTPGCIVFCYAPYEIAPYAIGEIIIYVPLKEIRDYLKPEIIELLSN